MSALPAGHRLREATADDAEALHALYHAAYSVHADPARPPGAALRDTLDDVRAYVRDSRVLVLEAPDGRLVATVATRRVANVRRLAVEPASKGQGFGAAMLEAALAQAAEDGFELAQLETLEAHPWLSDFYRRHGFADRGVERTADGLEWRVMRRRL